MRTFSAVHKLNLQCERWQLRLITDKSHVTSSSHDFSSGRIEMQFDKGSNQ